MTEDTGMNIIRHPSLAEVVAERVAERVMNGDFMPGEKISEARIAGDVGVSRSPVREALHQLAREGLVVIRPRIGTFVAPISPEEANNFYDCRLLLESECTRLAAPLVTERQIDELREILEQMRADVREDRVRDYLGHVTSFHELIQSACPNETLVDLIRSIWRRAMRFRTVSISIQGRSARSLDLHEELWETLRKRDAEAAVRVVHRVLQESRGAILKMLEASPDGFTRANEASDSSSR